MADVGLDRADEQRLIRWPTPAVHRCCRAEFGGIAHPRTRAVGLEVVDLGRREPGVGQRGFDGALLGRPFRHRESRPHAVLVHRRTADHRPDPVAVRLGLVESLQHHDAAAFAAHVAVGRCVEGLAPAVGREHPGLRAQGTQATEQDGLDATHQGEVGISPMQAGDRLVHGDQRGRTGGVHDHRRAFEAEHEGHAADGGAQRASRDGVEAGGRLGTLPRTENQVPVVVVAHAGVHAGASALEAFGIDAGVFQRPPTGLQHHALLGIQQLRFEGRDAEELGVELVDVVDECAVPAGIPLHRSVREQQPAHTADARSRRAFGDRRFAVVQQPPEGGQVFPTGEPAGHPHDGDGLPGLTVQCRFGAHVSSRCEPCAGTGSWSAALNR